jgi:hypothetical protein
MLKYIAREYLTVLKNCVVLNILKCTEKAFRRFFCALNQVFSAKNRHKAWNYFRGRMSRKVDPGGKGTMPVKSPPPRRAPHSTPLSINDSTRTPTSRSTPFVVKKWWWAYLHWLHDQQLDSQAYGAKALSTLPFCSFDAKHVTADTTMLHGLLWRIAKRAGGPKPQDARHSGQQEK